MKTKTLCLLTALAVGTTAAAFLQAQAPGTKRKQKGTALQKTARPFVDTGTSEGAELYYKTTVAEQIKLMTPDTIIGSKASDLLTYLGYAGVLTEVELHTLNSADIMAKDPLNILASRFFAPKVTDVQERAPAVPPPPGFGWRKLVRFKTKAGSAAETNGISEMYFLQNTFIPGPADDPYDARKFVSTNNQVILCRSEGQILPSRKATYFLLYGPLVKVVQKEKNGQLVDTNQPDLSSGNFVAAGVLINSLNATFDDDRDPEINGPAKSYFAPAACVECHGGNANRGKTNLLDTDHWFDRVTPTYGVPAGASPWYQTEDFTALAASPFGVLYDGGKDINVQKFKDAFEVLRRINGAIAKQNAFAGGNVASNFQLQAVKKWICLHAADDSHIPPYQRGFGDAPWDANNATHKKALYYFNRYCYRCHSSVRFNVFDRSAVLGNIGEMRERVQMLSETDSANWMPQDRTIPGLSAGPLDPATGQVTPVTVGEIAEFLQILNQLQNE